MTINSLKIFLQEFPLYKAFQAVQDYKSVNPAYNQPYLFVGETFNYFCVEENAEQTFELELPKSSSDFWAGCDGDRIQEILFNSKGELDFIHHFEAHCKSCKKYVFELTLHVWSDNIIPDSKYYIFPGPPGSDMPVDKYKNIVANLFIEKVGLFPAQKINLDNGITKHFDRETNNWYFKAVNSIHLNLGIAAFAYFRRIIEKELLTIVEEISQLDASESGLKKLYDEYKNTNQVSSIYDNIFELLPKSLQSLGINPIKTLYKQTSEGLHSLSDAECLERAESINLLLAFVIKKINEEKSEILKVRAAIKNLK